LSAVSGAVDSILSGSKVELDSLLEVVDAFKSADSELSGTISALTAAREAALSAEVLRAGSAEASLGTRITNVSSSLDGEIVRAKSAETSLNGRISTVSSSLSSSILAEETRAKSVETKIQEDLDTLEARTIVFNGTTNELEVSGSGVENNSVSITLGNSGSSITLGLPSDVTIGNNLTVTNNLVVSGSVTLGESVSDLTKVEGQFRIGMFSFADVPDGYKSNAADYAGHMFYLTGSGQDGSNFPFANKWYFNENGAWITHPVFVFDDGAGSGSIS